MARELSLEDLVTGLEFSKACFTNGSWLDAGGRDFFSKIKQLFEDPSGVRSVDDDGNLVEEPTMSYLVLRHMAGK